jgi:hypothetical protein
VTTQQFLEEQEEEQYAYKRETIEELIQKQYDVEGDTEFKKYQPVLYEIIKDPQQLQDKESLHETHDRFIERSE